MLALVSIIVCKEWTNIETDIDKGMENKTETFVFLL